MGNSGEKWLILMKSCEKVGGNGKKWEKMGKSRAKWENVVRSG